MHAKSLQSCLDLATLWTCSLPGSPVHGILQARILKWIATAVLQGIFPSQGSNSHLLTAPALSGGFFSTRAAKQVAGGNA